MGALTDEEGDDTDIEREEREEEAQREGCSFLLRAHAGPATKGAVDHRAKARSTLKRVIRREATLRRRGSLGPDQG